MSNNDLLRNFRGGTPTIRQSPFGYTGGDPAHLFADLGGGINPSGFVSNVDNAPGNVLIDDTGITITEGALTVRNAGGDPTVTAGEIVGGIAGSQLSGTIPAGVALGIAQTTVTSSGVKVNDGVDDRVILGAIGGGDYGLKVVSSDGTTVIIDGTSNVFKILVTGTRSLAVADDVFNSSSNDVLTGLGTFSATPAHLDFLASGNGVGDNQHLGAWFYSFDERFVASVAGGSPTAPQLTWYGVGYGFTNLDGSSQCRIYTVGSNNSGSSFTLYHRYYILKEAAL
jgi:hypothetical protein